MLMIKYRMKKLTIDKGTVDNGLLSIALLSTVNYFLSSELGHPRILVNEK